MTKQVKLIFVNRTWSNCSLVAQNRRRPPKQSQLPEQKSVAMPSTSASRMFQRRFVPLRWKETISLGIFDSNDKLVRGLQRDSKVDNFTQLMGFNQEDMGWKERRRRRFADGKYRASGYAVGRLKGRRPCKVEADPSTGHNLSP